MSRFKGVLFDFDGTLINSMWDHLAAWQAALKGYGVSIDATEYFKLEGTSVYEIASIFSKAKITPSPELISEIVRKKEEHYLAHYKFETYSGVEEILELLESKNIPTGIVTAGLMSRLEKSVPKEFLARFATVVTGEKNLRGKPFPDPYLRGSQGLKLKPEECLAVENAPVGITSAKEAGMYCVGVCSTLAAEYLDRADETVNRFAELTGTNAFKEILS